MPGDRLHRLGVGGRRNDDIVSHWPRFWLMTSCMSASISAAGLPRPAFISATARRVIDGQPLGRVAVADLLPSRPATPEAKGNGA